MPKKISFLTSAEFASPISKSAFRRMRRQEKRALMVEWFFQNFEDPAERLPHESAEGGYQWIWGGPADAEDEIRGQFEGFVPESLIKDVVDEIQADGLYEWSPVPGPDDYGPGQDDDYDDHEPTIRDDIGSVDDLPDSYGPIFGSHDEKQARDEAIDALRSVESLLLARTIGHGIGHNNPPSDVDADDQTRRQELREDSRQLREELEKPAPRIAVSKKFLRSIGKGFLATVKWIGGKLNIAVDEAVKTAAKGAVVAAPLLLDSDVREAVKMAFGATMKWIYLAAVPF